MYTAEDIRNAEFSKNMGGYKVAEVEAFMESCAQTIEALTNEKDELAKKLGILADKLMEYRRDEDSIRSALLSAQRTGDAIIREANDKAAVILNDASNEADEIVRKAKASIAHYEAELKRAKAEVSDFKAGLLTMYKEHITLLKSIPSNVEDVTASAQETVAPAVDESKVSEEKPPIVEEPPMIVTEPVDEEPMKIVPEEKPVETAPVRSKFANLKFGENYRLDDDQDD